MNDSHWGSRQMQYIENAKISWIVGTLSTHSFVLSLPIFVIWKKAYSHFYRVLCLRWNVWLFIIDFSVYKLNFFPIFLLMSKHFYLPDLDAIRYFRLFNWIFSFIWFTDRKFPNNSPFPLENYKKKRTRSILPSGRDRFLTICMPAVLSEQSLITDGVHTNLYNKINIVKRHSVTPVTKSDVQQ